EAPWLTPRSVTSAQGLIWKDVTLTGNTAHGFAEQIGELEGFLAENWRAGISPTTGNPVYQRPVILTLRREDHSFLLHPIMPRPAHPGAGGPAPHSPRPLRRALDRPLPHPHGAWRCQGTDGGVDAVRGVEC